VIEPQVIGTAKKYARKNQKSVSGMVEQYLALVSSSQDLVSEHPIKRGQLTMELTGCIAVQEAEDGAKTAKELIEEAKLSRFG
jgi:hypothetical protein